jgi:xanthine dehydrogenase accessory factor
VSADDPALARLLAASAGRQPAVWITDGRRRRVELATGVCGEQRAARPAPFEVRRLYAPAPRLIVFGADPVALAVATLAVQAGFETMLVRPRGPETPPPIPGASYSRAQPHQALAEPKPDPWTAIVVASHDWDADHDALVEALPSAAAYVGLLGSRRRLPERLAKLRAAVGEPCLSRLLAPIGLDLGAQAPWEIAIAVIGQIIAERRPNGLLSPETAA